MCGVYVCVVCMCVCVCVCGGNISKYVARCAWQAFKITLYPQYQFSVKRAFLIKDMFLGNIFLAKSHYNKTTCYKIVSFGLQEIFSNAIITYSFYSSHHFSYSTLKI